VVVGASGLFLVDAKNRAGRVTEWDGGLFQHTIQEGQPVTVSLAGELKKVHGMAAYMAAESGMPVTPVLCLAGAHAEQFGLPRMVRGVWVVPVSRLVGWLKDRPVTLDRDSLARAVVQAMTDFPSTTTDPALLAAMGHAAAAASHHQGTRRNRRAGRPHPASRQPASPPPRRSSGAARQRQRRHSWAGAAFGRAIAGLVCVALTIGLLHGFFSALPPTLAKALSPSLSKALPLGPSVAPPGCNRVTAAAVTSAIGRQVQPIATSSGCAWGTRLDDPSTMLVLIRMSASHAVYDTQLEASARQRRVVYGTDFDTRFRPATALWVATGQPIVTGRTRTRVIAEADTHIIIATKALGVTDDRARAMALAIAMAANRR
jgi:hypothetical protein